MQLRPVSCKQLRGIFHEWGCSDDARKKREGCHHAAKEFGIHGEEREREVGGVRVKKY